MKKMNNKGFSLVELIIVIAIMAVLIGVMAPQFMKYVERSRRSTDVQNVADATRVIQTYAMDPLIKEADQISDGNYNLYITATGNSADNANITKSLSDGGMKEIKLKSQNWHNKTGVKISIGVSKGVVSFADVSTGAGADGEDIINGAY